MGQFSWLYSDTGKQMVDGRSKKSYLLVPEEFQDEYGRWIEEDCYDGYGRFGKYDVYDLIAIWNRDAIPNVILLAKKGHWKCGMFVKEEILTEFYENGSVLSDPKFELRRIGIMLACYDEDNARLDYPIKITERPMAYKDAQPSESDPNQGWLD